MIQLGCKMKSAKFAAIVILTLVVLMGTCKGENGRFQGGLFQEGVEVYYSGNLQRVYRSGCRIRFIYGTQLAVSVGRYVGRSVTKLFFIVFCSCPPIRD